MNVHTPDCYSVDDLLIFGDITHGVICQGIEVTIPDQSNVETEVMGALENDLRTFLANLQEGERLQVQFYKNADYQRELERFQKITEKGAMCRFSRRQRTERYERYAGRMAEGRLIQSNLRFYLSSRIRAAKLRGGLSKRAHYERIVGAYKQSFDQRIQVGDQLLKNYGGGMKALNAVGHLRELLWYFGPAASKIYQAEEIFSDPQANLMQLARVGSPSPLEGPDRGFFLDGNYFGLVAFSTMPKQTFMGMMQMLTGLAVPDFRVVVNCYPLSVEKEILKTEDEQEKLERSTENKHGRQAKLRVQAGMEKNALKMRRLMSNQVLPFRAQFILIAHDETKEGLRSKMAALKGAVGKLGGIRYYEPSWEIATMNYFNAAIPGWSFDGYDDFTHKLDDVNLVDLLPIDGTPKGDLAKAEALYDGDAGNLIGVKTFSGEQGSEMPLHTMGVGAKGSGKSLLVNDLLVQTEPYYDYTVIVDNGLSYGVYTQCVEEGAAPIVIRSNGNHTFNPFDTRGLPLNNEMLANITALLSLLAGGADSPEKRRYREALMTSQVREIYADYYRRYRREHEDLLPEIAREALCVERWHKERSRDGDGFVDAFVDFREFKEREPEIRFDMSEYQTLDSIYRLLGHNGEEGLFGLNYDRVDGSGTLLFDEIEKAHERVLDLFLQLLSAARITLGSGRVLNLEKFYVAATSNIGSPLLISSKTNVRETLVRRVIQEAQSQMRPEIFDRFDRVLVFNRLSYEVQIDVARLHLEREIDAQKRRGHLISRWEAEALKAIVRSGYSEKQGARRMRNAAREAVQEAIRDALLSGKEASGQLDYNGESKTFFLNG